MISSLELAKLCGVSQGTVDRALHDRPGISPATKAKILALAERHGYRPHPAARELLTGERRTIGAVVPAVNSIFFMDLLNAIREAVSPEGFRFFITQTADNDECLSALEDFAARRARMALVVPPQSDLLIPQSLSSALPVAVLINPCEGAMVSLVPDETEHGRIATRYLLNRGHRRILHLTYRRVSPAIEARAGGYVETLEARGLPARVIRQPDPEELLAQVRQTEATALFCHNDWLALQAMRVLQEHGLRIPDDVSVLGVDDSRTFVSLCPDITTLHYPAESIAAALRAYLADEPVPPIQAGSIVERRTVAALRSAAD